MGTISDKLMRIINTKEDIRQALISKGYDVPTSIPFKEYAKMILDLPCNADSFPDIEGIVARYSASGLTNEQMAENPVWKDLTGNGHDLQMKNFLWGGMSGVGGYKLNWGDSSIWVNYITQGARGTGEVTDNTIHITSAESKNALFETRASLKSVEYKVLIKGLTDDIYLRYGVSNDGKELWTEIKNDGIYTLPSYDYDSKYNMKWVVMSQTYPIDCNITIEQLPLYPGALVFDGVDDYGTCENFPILTKEKGYTVVALRRWLSFQDIGYPTLVVNSTDRLAAFSFEDFRNETKSTWNWERSVGLSDYKIPLLYTYQTSTSYNGRTIPTGATEEGSNILQVCRSGVYCANAAIWEIVILDHDATEEELTKIKDYFVKTYPWLFPDQAWTVVGKTNEDEDRATIANITGNGNDLVLSNFGFAEGSGYGLYYQYFGNEFKATNGEIEGGGWNIIDNYNISHDKRIPINSIGKCFWGNKALVNGIKLRFKLTGMTEGDVLAFGYAATYDLTYTSDGIYAIDLPPVDKPYGFSLQSSLTENLPTTPVTIELLPFEYEGYMVTDGVDDIASSNTFVYEADFTFIGEWKFIQKDNTVAGINSSSHLYIQNRYNRGATVMINSTFENKKNITDYMTFKAITSKGKGYDENWNEVDLLYGDGNKGLSQVSIGGQGGSDFCHMIFKNMALYMNKVFSKDECIKAYNYLQTIKAK